MRSPQVEHIYRCSQCIVGRFVIIAICTFRIWSAVYLWRAARTYNGENPYVTHEINWSDLRGCRDGHAKRCLTTITEISTYLVGYMLKYVYVRFYLFNFYVYKQKILGQSICTCIHRSSRGKRTVYYLFGGLII